MPLLFKRAIIVLSVAFVLYCGHNFYYAMRWKCDVGSSSAHFRAGEYDQAIASARDALRIDPHFGETHAFLSRCYFKKGDYVTANREVKIALSMDPGVANYYHGYIVVLNQRSNNALHRTPAARSSLRRR